MQKLLATFLLATSICASAAQADHSGFTIKAINVEGLQRISKGTVYSYLPVKIGDELTTAESTKVIQDLYATSFFSNVALSRRGNTLIIDLKELPVIGSIHLSGNKDIPTKQLMKVLTQIGFTEGHVYNQVFIKQMTENGRTAIIAQQFVPDSTIGDKRILLLNGEPLGAILRVHSETDFRNNFMAGGHAEATTITERDLAIIAELKPHLLKLGLFFVLKEGPKNELKDFTSLRRFCLSKILFSNRAVA